MRGSSRVTGTHVHSRRSGNATAAAPCRRAAKCARGEFPGVKIAGNRWRIPAAYVDGIVNGQTPAELPDWLKQLAASGAPLTATQRERISEVFAEAMAGVDTG
jgi:hypothetical protein